MDDRSTGRALWRTHPSPVAVAVLAVALVAGLVVIAARRGSDDAEVGRLAGAATAQVAAPTTTSTTAAPTTTAPPTTAPPTTTAPPPTTAVAPAESDRRVDPTPPPEPEPAPEASVNCIVRLHGKGGAGAATVRSNGVTVLAPGGNAAGWGGRQWRYESPAEFASARAIVAAAVDEAGCTRVNLIGFSNGGAFAAALYCRAEAFDGRLGQVVVDDPVTDHAVEGCRRPAGVAVSLYWTGALSAQAQPGWECANADWTCAGGTTIGVESYAAALGTAVRPSPMSGHTPYLDPPELSRF